MHLRFNPSSAKPPVLNAWRELLARDSRGRCPRTRVGLLTNPTGKGTDPHARLKDAFLTAPYVVADDFCQSHRPKKRPDPKASLSESEVLTLAIFARFRRFASERDFYRYAKSNLRDAFPTLPDRSQFNRCVRSQAELVEELALHPARRMMEVRRSPYEAPDASAMPVRDAKRRGAGWGWPATPTHRAVQRPGLVRGLPLARRRHPGGGDSPASASPPPKTGRWPRPSSPCAASRTPGRRAWDRRPRDRTSPTRASRAKREP